MATKDMTCHGKTAGARPVYSHTIHAGRVMAARSNHCTAIVTILEYRPTPGPKVRSSGTALPDIAFAGICTFT